MNSTPAVIDPFAVRAPEAEVGALAAAALALARDLKLAFRRPAQLLQPLAFFALVTMLFPLSISP
jgi:heme exporter protein B